MVWQKSTTSHKADWIAFSSSGQSFKKLLVIGLALGVVWGIAVRVFYGLPGDHDRDVNSSLKKSQQAYEKSLLEFCDDKDWEHAMCKDYASKRGQK